MDMIDLKLDNIMVRLEDKSILDRDARDEREYPLPQKTLDDRKIYLSRNNYGQPSKIPGIVCITDFGLSKKGDVANYGCIQAEVYRAPEVILDAGWAYSADIWNLGVMVSSLHSPYYQLTLCVVMGSLRKQSSFRSRGSVKVRV